MQIAAARTPTYSYSEKAVGYDRSSRNCNLVSVFGNCITLKAGEGAVITVTSGYSTIHNGKGKLHCFHAFSIRR